MHVFEDGLQLAATDLADFLSCRYLTALEILVAAGQRQRPFRNNPFLDILRRRGFDHERRYVARLETEGRTVVSVADVKDRDEAVARTLELMRAGTDAIVQGALRDGRWFGKPDVLLRVPRPSDLGGWSYEATDTKLTPNTHARTILQLGLYSQLLETAQRVSPEYFHVVTPDPVSPVQPYRVDDYAAYTRLLRTRMEEAVARGADAIAAANYPAPVDHCDVCAWWSECVKKRHDDDHLSLVAGITRLQCHELESRGVTTLTKLATLPLPLAFRPAHGAAETYERVREQARVQLASRGRMPPLYEIRPCEDGNGLSRLPEPSPGDVFLDIEGDPFAADGGREYLFGVVTIEDDGSHSYRALWALNRHEERQAFESVIDLLTASLDAHPGMHVYHYAPYEPAALKRLMGRYVTREQELDRLLRAERFVDLYAVVRQGIRAGVERYSIKDLETLYSFRRTVPLPDANRALRQMEVALETDDLESAPDAVRSIVAGYNRDDCLSALHLRDWLEARRAELVAAGTPVPRPTPRDGDAPERVDARTQRVEALRARLLSGVPEAIADQTAEQHARWLLAYLLDFHRREDKATWWEYYRLRDLPDDELLDEPQAVAGLVFEKRVHVVTNRKTGKPTGSVIDRYRYPPQEIEIRRGEELELKDGTRWGRVHAIDRTAPTIDIEKGRSRANDHPPSAFAHTYVHPGVLEDAISAIGEHFADRTITSDPAAPHAVAAALLLGAPPRLASGDLVKSPDEDEAAFATRVVRDLDHSVIALQGPPGSGKTFTGARMICALVAQGKKVGVTANSHRVIRNLLEAVASAAAGSGAVVRLMRKSGDHDEDDDPPTITVVKENDAALDALHSGKANVLGGTAYLWTRPESEAAVDVLFVDEAGQMSLANALAASRATRNMVLLGDPQQLDQPLQATHPDGVSASALEHMLGEHRTMPPDRGIFLPTTRRLAPNICAFTSKLFYEGRLAPLQGLERQRITGVAGLEGSGLWVVPVEHDGNRSASPEEIEAVARLAQVLTAPGARWIDANGDAWPITGNDILVVSPYNAQVSRLAERLGPGVRVGTVDKFQGQEAPVVIYSMATSRPDDAPRGLEFLYSLHRLNVATSRAQCATIVVASPRLFEPECRTPRQMRLANALCRYRELARTVSTVRLTAASTAGEA